MAASSTHLTSWTDTVSSKVFTPTGTVRVLTTGIGIVTFPTISLLSTSYIITNLTNVSADQVFIVLYIMPTAVSGTILDFDANSRQLNYDDSNKTLMTVDIITGDGTPITIEKEKWYIIHFDGAAVTINIYDLQTGLSTGSGVGFRGLYTATGNLIIGNTAMQIAELIIYIPSGVVTIDVINHLLQKYYSNLSLPLTFPTNSSPTINS